MNRDDTLKVIHGLRLLLPPTWEDSSIYRFNAPRSDADAGGGEGQKLQPNVMVSRHEKRPGDSPEVFLDAVNRDAVKADPSYEVLRSGSVVYLDQLAHWQDARFTDARTQVVVSQRRVLAPTWPRHFTLLTLTGTAAAIEQMSLALGLEHLTAPRTGVDVDGVAAALVSPVPGGKRSR